MQQKVKVNSPCCYHITFPYGTPELFCMYSEEGKTEYFRWLVPGRDDKIQFNIPVSGNYTFSDPVIVRNITSIIVPYLPELPPAERNRFLTDPEIIVNPNSGSLADNYSMQGKIIVGQRWIELPNSIRYFILLHEKWHFFYRTEEFCDLGAYVDFMRSGYNDSTAMYSLSEVIHRTPENMQRLAHLLSVIEKTSNKQLSWPAKNR